MRHNKLFLVLCSLLVVAVGAVSAKETDETQLKQERSAIDKRLAAAEAACYQKFAVNGCLRSARQQARSERAAVQQRENDLKDAARRERTDAHRQELQDKQAAAAEKAALGGALPAPTGPQAHRPNPPAPSAHRSTANQSAHRSPANQSVSAGNAEQARARRAQDAAQARQRLLDKQSAAAERAQALQRRQAQREASGHPQAAPLPDPP